mgnify:CR=1 FL=1
MVRYLGGLVTVGAGELPIGNGQVQVVNVQISSGTAGVQAHGHKPLGGGEVKVCSFTRFF